MRRRNFLRMAGIAASAVSMQALPVNRLQARSPALDDARFDHVSLNVRAFDDLMVWYQEKLGFEIEVAWRVNALNGKRLAYLTLNDTRLELVEADANGIGLPEAADFLAHFARTGYGHLCFAVDDVDQILSALEEEGVPTFVRAETYALDGTQYLRRVGFVKDPEGNVLEFAEPLIAA
ncbi:MAG: VOC family protein [Pseudomonadota bacterium]